MMKRFFVFVMLALAALGCKKDPPPQPPVEPRWLRIYRDGEFEDSINVTGWDVNEDVLAFGYFYYPWQGEDSIDYNGHGYDVNTRWPWFFLNVNGKVVGVNTGLVDPSIVPDKKDIITITYELELNVEAIELFPNLVGLETPLDSLKTVASRYSDLRLYVNCGELTEDYVDYEEVTRKDLCKLSRYEQIRVVDIRNSNRIKAWDLILLARLKDLRVLEIDRDSDEHITKQNTKYLYKLLAKLRQIILTPVTITI